MTRRFTPWSLLLCAALTGCTNGSPPTQIVVVVDSNLTALTRIVVSTDDFIGARPAYGDVGPGEPALPRSVTLVHESGPLGPIRVTASALDADDQTLVERHAHVFFVRDEARLLRLELTRNCKSVHAYCGDDETCIDGECGSDSSELEPWTGVIPDSWL